MRNSLRSLLDPCWFERVLSFSKLTGLECIGTEIHVDVCGADTSTAGDPAGACRLSTEAKMHYIGTSHTRVFKLKQD